MPENETTHFTTLIQFVEWVKQLVPGEYLFRGVPDETYGIQTSAFRRLKSNRNFKKFVEINKSLIEDARLQGLDEKNGRELEDLEVLAELQHHGAATCLIDFSYSAQVALWFACGQDSKTPQHCNPPHGKVLAVRKDLAKFKKITPELLKKEIDYFLKDDEMARLYQWQPRHLNNRIIAQQSIFLFGHFQFGSDEECIIQEGSKQDILTELREVAGITEAMLFPDFDGFARLRSEGIPYFQPDTSDYRERGSELYQRGEYEQAITYYDEAIDTDPDDAQTYFLRGLAKGENEQYEDAIADFDTAIRLERNNAALATYYYNRSLAKDLLGLIEEEKDDLRIALGLATQAEDEDLKRLIEINLRNLS